MRHIASSLRTWLAIAGRGVVIAGALTGAVPLAAQTLPPACLPGGSGARGSAEALVLTPRAGTGDLADPSGRLYRQGELHVPASVAGKPGAGAQGAARAMTFVALDDAPDRWGRRIGHLRSETTGMWLAHEEVAAGRALVAPRRATPACLAPLFAAERAARAARAGLWARERVWSAHRPRALAARVGQYTLVTGRVLSVGETSRTLYLNFGRRWSRDFTATIDSRRIADFAAAGLDARSLEGAAIRVRGVLRQDRGPLIDLRHPAQIERLDKDGQSR